MKLLLFPSLLHDLRSDGWRSLWALTLLVLAAHAVVLALLIARTPDDLTLVAAGQPVTRNGVEVTLVAMPTPPAPDAPRAPTPPTPPTPPQKPPPPKPRPSRVVRASSLSRSTDTVFVPEPTPVKQPPPPTDPVNEPAPHTSEAPAPARAAAPTPVVPTIDLPGADARDARQLGCRIPQPAYPPRARRLGEEGTVSVQLGIDPSGRIDQAEIASSSGFGSLDEAAVRAVLAGRCEPRVVNGNAVRATARQGLGFKLPR